MNSREPSESLTLKIKEQVYLHIWSECFLVSETFSLAVTSISDLSETKWIVNGTLEQNGLKFTWFANVDQLSPNHFKTLVYRHAVL